MNNVTLIGRLTKDPELKYVNEKAVSTFTIAVNRPFKKDAADFFNIVVWGKIAENCANYLKKGSQAGIIGQIQNRSYDAQDGTKRYITEIIANSVEFLSKIETVDNSADVFSKAEVTEDKAYEQVKSDDVPF